MSGKKKIGAKLTVFFLSVLIVTASGCDFGQFLASSVASSLFSGYSTFTGQTFNPAFTPVITPETNTFTTTNNFAFPGTTILGSTTNSLNSGLIGSTIDTSLNTGVDVTNNFRIGSLSDMTGLPGSTTTGIIPYIGSSTNSGFSSGTALGQTSNTISGF